jgi:hypothetical protein
MPCNNRCCPPHNFFADRDPLPSDCQDSVVPGYETEGGYCTGSYWRNTVTGQIFIGIDDMGCDTATWMATNNLLLNMAHVKVILGAYQSIPSATSTRMQFLNVEWDANGDWDAGNHEFIAPRDGYYKVTVNTRYSTSPGLTTTGWALGDGFHVAGAIGGVVVANSSIGGSFLFQHATGTSQVFDRVFLVSSGTVYLAAGEIFTVQAVQYAAGAQTLNSAYTEMWIDEMPSYGMLP